MADTPRELDQVNSILITDDVLAIGPRTPWSPIRGSTGKRPGPIATTRLLDLEDKEFERPAEYSRRGGATTGTQRGAKARGLRTPVMKTASTMEKLYGQNIVSGR